MILSANHIFSENQAITATAISANVMRFPANDIVPYEAAAILRNLGPGNDMPFLIQVTQGFNNLTSLTFDIVAADDDALTVNQVILSTSGTVALARLTAGFRPPMTRIMPDGVMGPVLGLRYTVAGTAPTLGRVSAALATEIS